MEKIYLKSRAKINLNLEIINKRKDNYHNIKSVFQKINLYDELYIIKNNNNNFELETNIESLNNEENIVYKAYLKLKQINNNVSGVKVILNKKIPMQAGLGGGSTNCASFILGMNKLFNMKLSKQQIKEIGKSLGADVVPCLYNKAVLAEGIGDIITPINTNYKYYIVVVKPNISCNTKKMYELIDNMKKVETQDFTHEIIKGLENNNIEMIANNMHNIFEEVQTEKELIKNVKNILISNGAKGSLMTGSGSCIYGIFDEKQKAKKAFENLKNNFQTYICTSFNSKRSEKFD